MLRPRVASEVSSQSRPYGLYISYTDILIEMKNFLKNKWKPRSLLDFAE